MNVDGQHYRTIWLNEDGWGVDILDQTRFPHRFDVMTLRSLDDAVAAIGLMHVRGAPLVGATAAYGLCLQCRIDASDAALATASEQLLASRPTAINLAWAVTEIQQALASLPVADRVGAAYRKAAQICDDDVQTNAAIGEIGGAMLRSVHEQTGSVVNVLTHCNAGWLAAVDWGTATAPIYHAFNAGIPVHVWVDETRPRNQGAALTAWELQQHGVPHTVIVDNAGGHLMQHGQVDLCLVGSDRTTFTGDVCNKIGTYLKALAAYDNDVPFFAAVPSTTLDFSIDDGVKDIPIEQRQAREVSHITGLDADGALATVRLIPPHSTTANYAFDVTPARLVTGIITERGLVDANRESIAALFPDRMQNKAKST